MKGRGDWGRMVGREGWLGVRNQWDQEEMIDWI